MKINFCLNEKLNSVIMCLNSYGFLTHITNTVSSNVPLKSEHCSFCHFYHLFDLYLVHKTKHAKMRENYFCISF